MSARAAIQHESWVDVTCHPRDYKLVGGHGEAELRFSVPDARSLYYALRDLLVAEGELDEGFTTERES